LDFDRLGGLGRRKIAEGLRAYFDSDLRKETRQVEWRRRELEEDLMADRDARRDKLDLVDGLNDRGGGNLVAVEERLRLDVMRQLRIEEEHPFKGTFVAADLGEELRVVIRPGAVAKLVKQSRN
jgi:hypothetical protein